ncbi:hypothetical protein ACFLQI_00750 [Candidatus Undinarchaeota archaeon]
MGFLGNIMLFIVFVIAMISGFYYVRAHLYGEVRIELAAIFFGGLVLFIILTLFLL